MSLHESSATRARLSGDGTDERTATALAFGRSLAAKDRAGMLSLLGEQVDFEALTAKRHLTATSSVEVVDDVVLGRWFGPDDHITDLLSVSAAPFCDRVQLSYLLALRNADGDFLVEQHAYAVVDDGRIRWMRVLCSGYRPRSA